MALYSYVLRRPLLLPNGSVIYIIVNKFYDLFFDLLVMNAHKNIVLLSSSTNFAGVLSNIHIESHVSFL